MVGHLGKRARFRSLLPDEDEHLSPTMVCNYPPMLPNIERDRTMIPRTIPKLRVMR